MALGSTVDARSRLRAALRQLPVGSGGRLLVAAGGGGGALARHGQPVEVLQSRGHLLWADVVHWVGRRLGTQDELRKKTLATSLVRFEMGSH